MTYFSADQVAAVSSAVETASAQLIKLSHDIAADPELSYNEHRAMKRCADLLDENGFQVERGAYGQPTSFSARLGTTGPHVVLCAEYDALPGLGHACGHNIIAASAVGAGIALAPQVVASNLRVTVLGTHAEEVGGGKVDLINAGALDDADVALMMHPAPHDDYAPGALATEEWRVVYHGRSAHASATPELGINALDGLVAGYSAIALLRQHLRPLQQVHGIVVSGGDAPNIVPERTEASYYLRAVSLDDLDDLRHRLRHCLEGSALSTGTTVEITVEGHVFDPLKPHAGLVDVFTKACDAIGRPYTQDPAGNSLAGSTDFGNISQRIPGLHADMAVYSWPAVNHQHEFAAACITPESDRTLLDAAKALALTALAVGKDRSILVE